MKVTISQFFNSASEVYRISENFEPLVINDVMTCDIQDVVINNLKGVYRINMTVDITDTVHLALCLKYARNYLRLF